MNPARGCGCTWVRSRAVGADQDDVVDEQGWAQVHGEVRGGGRFAVGQVLGERLPGECI